MTNISYNLINKIDEKTVAILSKVDAIAHNLKLRYFIVGATARDIILQHAHDIHTARATLDVDLGVLVSGWDQFHVMKEALESTGKFSSTRQIQRLIYKNELPVDIVPFGGVVEDHGSITWPPKHEIEMSITGFQECYQHAVSVLVKANPNLVVKVATLAGLAILKLVSWDENVARRGKDATDLYIIIKNYIAAGNIDRFFEEYSILKEENSDYDRSSARFLGRDIKRIATQTTKFKLAGILKREAAEPQGHNIALDVLRQEKFKKETYEQVLGYFKALLRGLLD